MNLPRTTALAALQRAYADGSLSKAAFIAEACQLHQQLWDYLPHIQQSDVQEIRLTPSGVDFLTQPEGVRLLAPAQEARVAPLEALNFQAYEPSESMVMNVLASGARCILDVGANIGYHALRLARREPQAIIHAFEPLPTSFDYLQRNVALNQLGNQVRVYSHGLSDTNGSVNFFIAPENGVNASLKNVSHREDSQQIVGLTMTMDDWARNHNARPDYIKIDVEGAELLVLSGARNTLAKDRPKLFTELLRKWSAAFDYHPNAVLNLLAGFGYQCWAVGQESLRLISEVTDNTVETNYAFLHREAHRDTIALLDTMAAHTER